MNRTGGVLYTALVVVAVIAGLVAALGALLDLGYFLTALLLSMRGFGVNPAGLEGLEVSIPFCFSGWPKAAGTWSPAYWGWRARGSR